MLVFSVEWVTNISGRETGKSAAVVLSKSPHWKCMYIDDKVFLPCVWFECTNANDQEEAEGHAIDISILPFSFLSLLTRKEGLQGSIG